MGRVVRDHEGRGLGVVEFGRGVENAIHRRDRILRDPALGHLGDRDDSLTQPGFRALPTGVDRSADVHSEREGWWHRNRRHSAVAAIDVVEVERSCRDFDAHLARPGLGNGKVDDFERFARAGIAGDLKGLHS